MELPTCIRCGMCCIVAPCHVEEGSNLGYCKYLTVNDDLTTTCERIKVNDLARRNMVGTGCLIRCNEEIYNLHLEEYSVEKVKRKLLQRQRNSGTDS